MELHKQQLEFQQFTLQKNELQQKKKKKKKKKKILRIAHKFIKWLKNLWKKHDIFPQYNL